MMFVQASDLAVRPVLRYQLEFKCCSPLTCPL